MRCLTSIHIQGHGTLNAIYAATATACAARGWDAVDLLIIGGDFQATRNAADLNVMSVPAKYRAMGDFEEYYSGRRKAPYLTIFVGGNHEAASHLWELYYGGWVAPNIYYMGAANVLRFGPLRIAGMSGIWKGMDYRKPHFERLPFSYGDVRSFYHVREFDVRKLLQIREQVDVGISHDWPRGIEKHGDQRWLFKNKPDFEADSRDGTLGSVAAEYVLNRLRPPYWFSAHLHCRFAAIKTYDDPATAVVENLPTNGDKEQSMGQRTAEKQQNPDEIELEEIDEENDGVGEISSQNQAPNTEKTEAEVGNASSNGVSEELRAQLPNSFAKPAARAPKTVPGQPLPPTITNKTVRFLALDKCLPGRKFLQLSELLLADLNNVGPLSVATERQYKLQYDPEWLAITRVFAKDLVIGDKSVSSPEDLGQDGYMPLIETERAWVDEHIVSRSKLDVPDNFVITAPIDTPGASSKSNEQPKEYTNPQTVAFCDLLQVPNLWDASAEERQARRAEEPPAEERRHSQPRQHLGGARGRGRGRGRGSRQRGWVSRMGSGF
jgi:lariat debranching enzyme